MGSRTAPAGRHVETKLAFPAGTGESFMVASSSKGKLGGDLRRGTCLAQVEDPSW